MGGNVGAIAAVAAGALSLCIVLGIFLVCPSLVSFVLTAFMPLLVIAAVLLANYLYFGSGWKVEDISRPIQVSGHLKMKASYLPKSIPRCVHIPLLYMGDRVRDVCDTLMASVHSQHVYLPIAIATLQIHKCEILNFSTPCAANTVYWNWPCVHEPFTLAFSSSFGMGVPGAANSCEWRCR